MIFENYTRFDWTICREILIKEIKKGLQEAAPDSKAN
jgi:hypothetical protein